MHMNKKSLARILIAVGVFYILYLTAIIYQSDFWGNILAPIGDLLSFCILFQTFRKANKADFRRYIWLTFSLAALSWAMADILWAVDVIFLARNPDNNQIAIFLYFGTNIFLIIGLFIFTAKTVTKWNALQLFVDAIAISISCLFLIWIIFLDKDLNNIGLVVKDGWVSGVSIIIDFATFIGIAVWYISSRTGKIHYILKIIIGFTILYSVTDIIYYYLYFKNLYTPNSFIDALYMAALLGIAIGAYMVPVTYYKEDTLRSNISNMGYTRKGLLLLLMPLAVILKEGFILSDLFMCGLIITAHNAISHFIQSSFLNAQLLDREKSLNLELEKKIAERTSELVEKNIQLDFLSNKDTVTNLNNRRYFLQEMEKTLLQLGSDEKMALAFLDLDRFKTINDSYGHYIGDQILIELAKRLTAFEKPDTLVARLGGDEFVIAFSGKFTLCDAEDMLRQVVLKCSEPIQAGEYTFEVTVSVGISMYPVDADSLDRLLRNADMAMYQAKKEGNNRIVVFNNILNQKNLEKNKIEISLKKADFDNEFMLYYQPQFTIPGKQLIGMEALLRWNCPGKGFVGPAEFIPIAEEINSIIPIGDWVMTHAVSQIAQWNRQYSTNLKMAVNVSPKQLDTADFSRQILSVLALEGIPPEWIDVEITEGIALEGNNKISKIAEQFKGTGITISIDDFGTGYSSLSYLKIFPFHRVKIALQLIDNILFDRYDLQIVRSILLLAESIGVDCIAEGVETQEQFDLLHGLGCRQMQGYYLGRPVPAVEFEKRFLEPN